MVLIIVMIINVGGHDSCPDDDNGDVVNYSDDRGGGIGGGGIDGGGEGNDR